LIFTVPAAPDRPLSHPDPSFAKHHRDDCTSTPVPVVYIYVCILTLRDRPANAARTHLCSAAVFAVSPKWPFAPFANKRRPPPSRVPSDFAARALKTPGPFNIIYPSGDRTSARARNRYGQIVSSGETTTLFRVPGGPSRPNVFRAPGLVDRLLRVNSKFVFGNVR